MPAELMIERDKLGQTNQQSQLKTQQTHTTHAQVQWANYLPNTCERHIYRFPIKGKK